MFRPRFWLGIAIIPAVLLWAAGCGSGSPNNGTPSNSTPSGSTTPAGGTSAPIQHSFVGVIVLENTNYSDVINAIQSSTAPNAPYLHALLASGALVTNYFADRHPSIDNYFIMTDGKPEANNDDNFSKVVSDDNLARELAAAGKTWKVYAEGIPSAGYLGSDSAVDTSQASYVKHHNPFAYFSDVASNPQQAANIVSFSQLSTDLSSGAECSAAQMVSACLPNYAFIVPDTMNDGEICPDGKKDCAPAVRVANADIWLQTNIAPLLASPGFQQSGLLMIVFDESQDDNSFGTSPTGGGGHVFALLLGAKVKAGYSQQTTTVYDHASLLLLTVDSLGLTTQLPLSNATAMSEFLE